MAERDAPTVTVIVPAYQTADLIGESLGSLQAQGFEDWEAVVVDDGSTDDLRGALAPFSSDSRIKVHHFENGGIAAARNRGIALARGRYISFLDSDDLYEPDYLAEMVGRLEADPALAFVCCDATMFGLPEREGRRYSEFEPQDGPVTVENVLTRRFNVYIAAMIRADALRSVGGFAEDLASGEDLDLWIRLLMAGGGAAYVPRALCRYRRRAGSLTNSPIAFHQAVADVYRRTATALGPAHPLYKTCRQQELKALALSDLWRGRMALAAGRIDEALYFLPQAIQVLKRPRWRAMLRVLRRAPRTAMAIGRWKQKRMSGVARLAQPTSGK